MNPEELRIGDAEREHASTALGEHLAQGRLDVSEHAERLDAVWSARTRGDLVPVFADLPAPRPASITPAPATAPTPAPARPAPRGYWSSGPVLVRRGRPGPLPVVLGVLLVLTVATHLPFVLLALLAWVFVARRHHAPYRHR